MICSYIWLDELFVLQQWELGPAREPVLDWGRELTLQGSRATVPRCQSNNQKPGADVMAAKIMCHYESYIPTEEDKQTKLWWFQNRGLWSSHRVPKEICVVPRWLKRYEINKTCGPFANFHSTQSTAEAIRAEDIWSWANGLEKKKVCPHDEKFQDHQWD